jgi:hypothetical protein
MNAAMEAGVAARLAEKKRVADNAAVAGMKAQAQGTHQNKLAKIGICPDDPLMLVPEGLGPSREEVQNICKQVTGQAKKRKLRDTEGSVCGFPNVWCWTSELNVLQGACTYCARRGLECVPGTAKACMSCNTKKVRCSYLGAKPSAEIIVSFVSSNEEVATPRPKRPKTAGIVPKARPVSVVVGKSAKGLA